MVRYSLASALVWWCAAAADPRCEEGCASSRNAAEHMNLPLSPDQLASSPDQRYGHTEMKGSWFVFDQIKAHEDHCRWRAPYWHGTRVMNDKSHRNYHLGFRCCASIRPR